MEKLQNLVNETATIADSPERLNPPEWWWSKHQPFLAEKCGCMLRTRYKPAWIPSWYGTYKNPRKCEDGIPTPVLQAHHYMDAIRMVDSEPVLLKRVRAVADSPEARRAGASTKTNGSVSREQSRTKRKHYTTGGDHSSSSAAPLSQTYISKNGSRSFKSSSNASVHVSTKEEKANSVEPDPREVQILNMLSSKHYDLPTNYCARLIDVFDISDNSGNITDIVLVLPFLRPFNDPPFLTIGEGLDFIRQALDAVLFLHSNNIAHKDCGAASFMYDPSYIYPEGYHPVMIQMTRDLKRRAKHHSRTEFPPRYYITNFSHAKLYDRSEGVLDYATYGSDHTVPEYVGLDYSGTIDPFATDVYLFGNMLRKEFLENKQGFEFLAPLIDAMTDPKPDRRPRFKQCAERFFSLCVYIPKSRLRKRFVSGLEGESEKILNSVSHIFRNVKYSVLGIPPAYMGQHIGKTARHYEGAESPYLWGKLGETTWRVSCELVYLRLVVCLSIVLYAYRFNLILFVLRILVTQSTTVSAPPQRSHSFSHARPAEWKSEFVRQQKMHRMQLEKRAHESFSFNQPQNSHEAGVSRREQFLIHQQPYQNRGRTASDSGYYYNPRISSTSPSPGRVPPTFTFSGKRTTPPYSSSGAQTPLTGTGHTQGREYHPPRSRVYTDDTDNTETTHIESISSVTQTQETFVENGNGNANRDGGNVVVVAVVEGGGEADVNGDVSHLDLGLDGPDASESAGPAGARTPKEYRLLDKVEKEEQEAEIRGLTSRLESERAKEFDNAATRRGSKSKPAHSGTVRSTESSRDNDGRHGASTSKSKSKSKSKPTHESVSRLKDEKRDSIRTRGTAEFNIMFPEPDALSPVLSPMYKVKNDRHSYIQQEEGERAASPATIPTIPPHSPTMGGNGNVPASLLTGPALTNREGSIRSFVPVPASQVFEDGISPVDNVVGEEGRKELNGARLAQEGRHEAGEGDKRQHRHKHKSGEHHHHHHHRRESAMDESPKRERSTKWDCVLCLQQLSSRAESIEHMQSKHSSYHICLQCGSYYTTAKHLKLHQEKRRHTNTVNPHPHESRKHKHHDGEYYDFPSSNPDRQ